MSHFRVESVPDKCRACRRCEIACIAAHHGLTFKEALKKRDELVSRVHVVREGTLRTSVSCHQCQGAPCVRICPSGVLRQADDGSIAVNVQYCSGCMLCIMACPYGVISLEAIGLPASNAETMAQRFLRTVAVRCDMCSDWRRKEGKSAPACVEACPAQARRVAVVQN